MRRLLIDFLLHLVARRGDGAESSSNSKSRSKISEKYIHVHFYLLDILKELSIEKDTVQLHKLVQLTHLAMWPVTRMQNHRFL